MSDKQPEWQGRNESRRIACEYDNYLRGKIDIARAQRGTGSHVSDEEIEAEAADRRAELWRRIQKGG